MSTTVKPAARVKAVAKQLVDPLLLSHMTPGAQQMVQELRAQLLEAVKLTPSERVKRVVKQLNDATLQILMTRHAGDQLASMSTELLEAATQLEELEE